MTNAIGCEASAGDDSEASESERAGDPGRRDVLGTIRAVLRSGGALLTDLIDRFVGRVVGRVVGPFVQGIRVVTSLALLGAGCQSTSDVAKVAPPTHEIAPLPAQAPKDTGPRQLGQFTITFYYVIGEDEVPAKKPVRLAANDNRPGDRNGGNRNEDESDTELASITPDLVTLYAGGSCEPIAEVSKEFASQIALQGTGKLHDGRVVNIFGACKCHRSPCFKVTQAQWGTSGSGRPLQPFRTIAVDPRIVKLGSLLYLPLLEGRTMPGRSPWGGYIHDGCVVADDTGGHIAGNRIDLFVGRKAYFVGLGRSGSGGSHAWARHVPVFDGSAICQRKGRVVSRKSGSI